MVASDRISAYDVIMPDPIPDKGKVLTQMSVFWFETTGEIVPNHLISEDVPEEVAGPGAAGAEARDVPGRVRRPRLPLRARAGRSTSRRGAVCGIALPDGPAASPTKLPEPIFTPATKAEIGEHDENIDFERAGEILGDAAAGRGAARVSIALYEHAADHAAERGIILADTKFEFGSLARRRDRARRRGADPGLLALLARRRLRARPRPGLVRQAVRARLPRRDRLGPQPAGARAARRGRRRTPAPSTSRPTSGSPAATSELPARLSQ